ncbi:hypothetical protein [Streptomyces sp. BBFR102]|uniref:hypothetical protein n=1 Tax=Streptomyces sp. BBFR102 TaxID=3448171 RepID=UPI003F53493F
MAETDVPPPPRDADAVVFGVGGVAADSTRVHATARKEAPAAHPRAHPARRRPFDAAPSHTARSPREETS